VAMRVKTETRDGIETDLRLLDRRAVAGKAPQSVPAGTAAKLPQKQQSGYNVNKKPEHPASALLVGNGRDPDEAGLQCFVIAKTGCPRYENATNEHSKKSHRATARGQPRASQRQPDDRR